MQNRELVEDLLCVDSLDIFRKIDESNRTESALEELLSTDLHAVQNRNEKTPSKTASFCVTSRAPYEKPSSARRLFSSQTSEISSSNTATMIKASANRMYPRTSYKLCDIYKRLHENIPSVAHNAEADTMHLLLCAIAVKEQFVKETDLMATKFTNVKC